MTPVLTFLEGVRYPAKKLQVYLKQKATQHSVDPATVTLHGLRTGQVTHMVNDELQNNPVALLAVSGHASLHLRLRTDSWMLVWRKKLRRPCLTSRLSILWLFLVFL